MLMHFYVGFHKRNYTSCGKLIRPKDPEGRVNWTSLTDWVTCKSCLRSHRFLDQLAEDVEHALKGTS